MISDGELADIDFVLARFDEDFTMSKESRRGMLSIVRELRHYRAARLTVEEVESLRWVSALMAHPQLTNEDETRLMRETLDKLLAAYEVKP